MSLRISCAWMFGTPSQRSSRLRTSLIRLSLGSTSWSMSSMAERTLSGKKNKLMMHKDHKNGQARLSVAQVEEIFYKLDVAERRSLADWAKEQSKVVPLAERVVFLPKGMFFFYDRIAEKRVRENRQRGTADVLASAHDRHWPSRAVPLAVDPLSCRSADRHDREPVQDVDLCPARPCRANGDGECSVRAHQRACSGGRCSQARLHQCVCPVAGPAGFDPARVPAH